MKVEERPRAACSDGCELAEEKKLDMLSAAVERHLSGNQEDACRLGDILNVHVLLQPPVEF